MTLIDCSFDLVLSTGERLVGSGAIAFCGEGEDIGIPQVVDHKNVVSVLSNGNHVRNYSEGLNFVEHEFVQTNISGLAEAEVYCEQSFGGEVQIRLTSLLIGLEITLTRCAGLEDIWTATIVESLGVRGGERQALHLNEEDYVRGSVLLSDGSQNELRDRAIRLDLWYSRNGKQSTLSIQSVLR